MTIVLLSISPLKRALAWVVIMTGLCVVAAGDAAAGDIDPSSKYAWAENAGWANFAPTHGEVTVVPDYLAGYVWCENIGWLKLGNDNGGPYANTGANDWGVNLVSGKLTGYAWSENCGWVNFNPTHSQVTVDRNDGSFDGYAWAENMGWIHFKNASPAYNVRTTASLWRGMMITIR